MALQTLEIQPNQYKKIQLIGYIYIGGATLLVCRENPEQKTKMTDT